MKKLYRFSSLADAYNRGSDARLAGLGKEFNKEETHKTRMKWVEGWDDVHTLWGSDANYGWCVRKLPPVKPFEKGL